MSIDDIKLFTKTGKTIGYSDRKKKEYRWRYWDGIWHRKRRHAYNEKWKKPINRNNRIAKQERIGTLVEKENYDYLGILDADTIKQAEIKEKK